MDSKHNNHSVESSADDAYDPETCSSMTLYKEEDKVHIMYQQNLHTAYRNNACLLNSSPGNTADPRNNSSLDVALKVAALQTAINLNQMRLGVGTSWLPTEAGTGSHRFSDWSMHIVKEG